ncbi:hypothetical protein [Paraburkholderia strydomiana]|uniref:hypothetical protein n=1 Tax=Paraburkholderia strydomiana TaxID=1245417 RepID=UPI0038BE0E98
MDKMPQIRSNAGRRHVLSATLLSFTLSACVSHLAPLPPAIPTATDIKTKADELAPIANLRPTFVATIGYNLAYTECNHFFDSVSRMTNDASFNRKEVTLAGAAAAGILAALNVSAQAIALTAIGFALTADSIDNFQNFALFTSNPGNVSGLVGRAMAAYRTAAPPEDPSIMTTVATAQSYVSGYAELCTYRKIQELISQAILKATPVDAGQESTTIFSSSDRLLLGVVNADLGLTSSLLTDAQYTQLYWYLKTGYSTKASRDEVLNAFSDIKGKLWDSTSNALPQAAKDALKTMEAIARTNTAFANAVQALVAAKSQPGPAAAAPPPGNNTSAGQPAPTLHRIPNIQIR